MTFPSPLNQSPTLTAMHAYSRILGAIRAAQTEPHHRWWHGSLQVVEDGLSTGEFPTMNSVASLTLDPTDRLIRGAGSNGPVEVALSGPASEVGRAVLRKLGGDIDVDPDRWDSIGVYEFIPTEAVTYHAALRSALAPFSQVRDSIEGEVGPIQFWPHHFDLSFEWFSKSVEVNDEEDGPKEHSKQIGFGFSPGDETETNPYFYANPWPFDETFRQVALPAGASWHEEGWSGGFLPYAAVAEGGSELLQEFMRAVFDGTQEALS